MAGTQTSLYTTLIPARKDPADDTIANFDVSWVMTFFCTYKVNIWNMLVKFIALHTQIKIQNGASFVYKSELILINHKLATNNI